MIDDDDHSQMRNSRRDIHHYPSVCIDFQLLSICMSRTNCQAVEWCPHNYWCHLQPIAHMHDGHMQRQQTHNAITFYYVSESPNTWWRWRWWKRASGKSRSVTCRMLTDDSVTKNIKSICSSIHASMRPLKVNNLNFSFSFGCFMHESQWLVRERAHSLHNLHTINEWVKRIDHFSMHNNCLWLQISIGRRLPCSYSALLHAV